GTSAIFLPTSLPFAFLTLMIDTLLASRLTTTKRLSSEVSAIVVERVGAASAVFCDIGAASSAAVIIASAALPRTAASELWKPKLCDFMFIPSGASTRIKRRNHVRKPPSVYFGIADSSSVIRDIPINMSGNSRTMTPAKHDCRQRLNAAVTYIYLSMESTAGISFELLRCVERRRAVLLGGSRDDGDRLVGNQRSSK